VADERAARLAALIWIFTPSVVLEGATSMDAVFATAAVATVLLFLRARVVAAAVAAVLCSFLSYALLGAVAWAVALIALRGRPRLALQLAAATAVAAAAGYALLWWATGYDPLAALRATSFAYDHGISRQRPGWYWAAGDLTAFFVALGPVTALAFAGALGERRSTAVVTMGVLLAAALGGFTKAEVERIWLFLVPFVAVSAAPGLRAAPPRLVLAALAAQTLAVELAFGTTW
jgi:hypothetical protein